MDNIFYQPVADFYTGKSIFITGATGFIGKVLVEKFLYACPKLDKIYVLIREKKGVDINTRLQNMFENSLFTRLKESYPNSLNKVVPIYGDLSEPRLGISPADEHTLTEKVSVVIHSAANVKFNEHLKKAWRVNVEGTKMILELAQRMKRIEIFLHMSTAYTNTDRQVIEEVLYEPPADINDVCHSLTKQDLTEEDTQKIIYGRPNTYTFTKALTEHLVADNIIHMPTVIIRPSTVGAIQNSPIKGWLENWFGATGMMMFTTNGLSRVLYGEFNNILDIIPVDYVTNLVIVAGARNFRSRELKIYNCCSSGCNPLLLGKLAKTLNEHAPRGVPFPKVHFFTKRSWLISIITLLLQVIPAYIADGYRRLVGKQPMYVKLQYFVTQTRLVLNYFTGKSWIMKADHTQDLFSSLSASDKKTFPCDPASINWNEYLKDYLQGVQELLQKNT